MLYLAFVNLPIGDTVTWSKKDLPLEEGELQCLFEDLLLDVLLNIISLPLFEVFGPSGPTVLREQSVAQKTNSL